MTAACMLSGCLTGIAGSGSQTTNGVTVASSEKSITISADSGLSVRIFSSDFIKSGFSGSAIMESNKHTFDSLPDGRYSVLVKRDDGKAAFFQDIPVSASQSYRRIDSLQATGSIRGSISGADSSPVPKGLVYIKGTPFNCITDESSEYLLDSIPPGSYQVSFHPFFDSITDTIPGDTGNPNLVVITSEDLNKILNLITVD